MTLATPWIVVLVIVAVLLASRAGNTRRGRSHVALIMLVLLVGLAVFASQRSRSTTTSRTAVRSSSTRPAAVVEVKDGRLVIRADALREYLPPEITFPRPPAPPPSAVVPPVASSLPAPRPPALEPDSEEAQEELAAAIDRYFDQVLEEQVHSRLDKYDLRPLLARLKSSERRRLADEVVRHAGESRRPRPSVTGKKTSGTVETYTLQLDGDAERWGRLVTPGVAAASPRSLPLIVRLALLFGMIVVAAAVLRGSIARPGPQAGPAAKS